MSIIFTHRHVLDDHLSGFESNPNPNHLTIARRPVIFSVLAHTAHERDVAAALTALPGFSIRACGPAEWLAVSETIAPAVAEDLLTAVAGASVVDQSDGRVLLAISGPSVRKILAKCVAADLHPDAFAEGYSTNMMCCHVGANVTRTGGDTFEIVVPRSFAGSVFEEVMEMGREYALTRSFAG